MKKFSAIVPAYNEWPRIKNVLKTLLQSEKLTEIIVIDDGSSDNTKSEIQKFENPKIKKIFKEKNEGKSRAVMDGVLASNGDYIVMIDSDLIWLQKDHINQLIEPIEKNLVDTTLSIRENSFWIYKFFGTDFVSWERIVPKNIFIENEKYFVEWKWFGLEVKINEKIIEKNLKIKNIFLKNVITPRKSKKMWFLKWTIADFKMVIEILQTFPIHKIIRQFWIFSRFSKQTKNKPN